MIDKGCKQCKHLEIIGSTRGRNGGYTHLYQCQKMRFPERICEDYEEKEGE